MVIKKLYKHILFLLINVLSLAANADSFTMFGDTLIWHASQETSSTWANIVSKPASHIIDFDATNVDYDWNVGFRGGIEYQNKPNNIDSKLYWTHFFANTNSQISLAEQILLPEFFSGFVSTNYFFGANLDWKLNLNMLDLELGRKINLGKSVTIRSVVGVKGGTIKQTANCAWRADIYTATEQITNNYSGIGPKFGVDSAWNIYKSLNLIGNFSSTFMYGQWKLNDVYSRPEAAFGLVTPTTITTSLHKSQLGTIVFEYFMGMEWKYISKFNINLQLGYEMQFWTNQLRLPTFQQLPVHGDLTLQGATCHISIEL